MAKDYYKDDVDIRRGSSFREFDSGEIATHVSPEIIESGDIKLVRPEKIAYKIQLSTFNRTYIDIDLCKTLDKKDHLFPKDSAVRHLANMLADKTSVNVWLDRHQAPIFLSSNSDILLLDAELYDKADELSLDFLVESTNLAEFKVEDWFLISSDLQVWYIRNKLGLSKLFAPYMLEQFDDLWPGLMVGEDYEDGENISKLGFRTLLQMFIFHTGAHLNTSAETFPPDAQFSISIPQLINSDLNGGLTLTPKQTKQLEHMMPDRSAKANKEVFSFGKNVISNPKDISEPYKEHKNYVTWAVFTSMMEMFPIGCSVVFGPNQIVLDSEERMVFSTTEIELIIYHGPDFVLTPKRNTIDVVVKGDTINVDLRARLIEYFDSSFDLSVHTMRTEGNASEILTGKDSVIDATGYLL